MHTQTGIFARLAFGGLLILSSLGAQAQALDKPLVLVAAPDTGGFYARTVMVVVPRRGGHAGFILNRATSQTVADAFPDEPESLKLESTVYLGGPVEAHAMYAVVPHDPGEGARRLFGDVFVTLGGTAVDRVIRNWPMEARFFAGYAAWAPGELAEQVAAGTWMVAAPERSMLFHAEPARLWEQLVTRLRSTL
jgi:putative transcriptional regulator